MNKKYDKYTIKDCEIETKKTEEIIKIFEKSLLKDFKKINTNYDLTYNINRYDHNGEVDCDCILINLGNGVILFFHNLEEYENFIIQIITIRPSIIEEIKKRI